MATVTIEPVAWRAKSYSRPDWHYAATSPRACELACHNNEEVTEKVEPLYTADALATARAEGKAEGMRDAAGIAEAEKQRCRARAASAERISDRRQEDLWAVCGDTAGVIRDAILAAIPAPQETLP